MPFIAGPFTATYGGNPIGVMEDGIELEFVNSQEEVIGDNIGTTIQDTVWLGGNLFLNIVLSEYSATGIKALIWPQHATLGNIGVIGQLGTNFDAAFVATPITGTSANLTYTFASTILAPGFDVRIPLKARLRKIPIRILVLPENVSAEIYRWFSTV